MARLNFVVSLLVCISFSHAVFCSEVAGEALLNNLSVSKPKLFEDENEFKDEYEFEGDELENIIMTPTAIKYFLILQDLKYSECPEGKKLQEHDNESEIDAFEDYFLVGNGYDIEYVEVDGVSQLNTNKVHSDLGLACSGSEESFN